MSGRARTWSGTRRSAAALGAAVGLLAVAPAAASVDGKSIAAVLECDGPVYGTGVREGSEGGGSASPEEAVRTIYRGSGRALPVHGYEILEHSADAVSFGYRHNDGIRAVVRVERDAAIDGAGPTNPRTPWTWTSYASCDPVEYAASTDDEIGIGLVRRADGTRLPARFAHLEPAMQHCRPGAWTLLLGRTLPTYVRDPQGAYANEWLVPYERDAKLPITAVDTGLRTGAFVLFTDADPRAIYAAAPGHVERWPARVPELKPRVCA
jgi:hypothetical protein